MTEHLGALREELVSGDAEWDRKVDAILAQYETLARENAERQRLLAEAQEARGVAESFAAMGDIAANLLHHLNNQVGTIPVRVEGIQDKCAAADCAKAPTSPRTWPRSSARRSPRCRRCANGWRCCGPSRRRRSASRIAWTTRSASRGCLPESTSTRPPRWPPSRP